MSALCLRKSLQITGLVLHRLTCAWNAVRVALSPLVDACNRLRIPLFAPDSRGVYGLSNRSKVGIRLTHQAAIPSMRGWKTILGT